MRRENNCKDAAVLRTKHLDVLATASPNQHNYRKLKLGSNTKGKSTISLRDVSRLKMVEDCRTVSSHSTGHCAAPYWAATTAAASPPLIHRETHGTTRKYTSHTNETPEDNRIRSFFQARSQKESRSHEFCKSDRNTNPWKGVLKQRKKKRRLSLVEERTASASARLLENKFLQ